MFQILIVDDNKMDREGIKDLIDWQKLGITVVEMASNGKEGLDAARKYKPEIVLTDVSMPVLDGIAMTEAILKFAPRTKFIYISCFQEFDFVKKAIDLDVVGYVLKPIKLDELHRCLEKTIEEIDDINRQSALENRLNGDLDTSSFLTNSVTTNRYRKITEDIIELLNQNYGADLNIDGLLNSLNISAGHANSIFKEVTGKSIFEFLFRIRMEKAKMLLQDPYARVYEVARRVGYRSNSHFGAAFKDYTGLTPKQFADFCKT